MDRDSKGARAAVIDRQVVHQGWSSFLVARIRLADGAEISREIEQHGDAVAVLPYDPERRSAYLVRLLRAPLLHLGIKNDILEPPAGMIDAGETPEAAARREAWEEVGLRIDRLERIATAWTSPGVSTERLTLFLAPCTAEDRAGRGGGMDGEHENILVEEDPLAELWRQAQTGKVEDMKLLALIQALRLRRPDLFDG